MDHLVTERHPSWGWRLTWLRANSPLTGKPIFTQEFSRVAMGMVLDKGPHIVIVGERRLVWRSGSECYYWVLDEAQDHLAARLLEKAIRLKDQYQVERIYAPNMPTQLIEALRHTEGLTHYKTDDNEDLARKLWPTFHGFDAVAAVAVQAPPEDEEVHRALEEFLMAPVIDQDTREKVVDLELEPITRLSLPNDFPNQHTSAGIRQMAQGACLALWLVVTNLYRTRNTRGREHKGPQRTEKSKGNPVTGY